MPAALQCLVGPALHLPLLGGSSLVCIQASRWGCSAAALAAEGCLCCSTLRPDAVPPTCIHCIRNKFGNSWIQLPLPKRLKGLRGLIGPAEARLCVSRPSKGCSSASSNSPLRHAEERMCCSTRACIGVTSSYSSKGSYGEVPKHQTYCLTCT